MADEVTESATPPTVVEPVSEAEPVVEEAKEVIIEEPPAVPPPTPAAEEIPEPGESRVFHQNFLY